jgi:hypothetical protein
MEFCKIDPRKFLSCTSEIEFSFSGDDGKNDADDDNDDDVRLLDVGS